VNPVVHIKLRSNYKNRLVGTAVSVTAFSPMKEATGLDIGSNFKRFKKVKIPNELFHREAPFGLEVSVQRVFSIGRFDCTRIGLFS